AAGPQPGRRGGQGRHDRDARGEGRRAHRHPVGRRSGPGHRRSHRRRGAAEDPAGDEGRAGDGEHREHRGHRSCAAARPRDLAMANFFIRRPIVAIVISIIIVMLGLNSLRGLSFEQYPFLAPPMIRITATYPGASAVAVEQSVATPVEQEVNGVERMIYMKSSNTSDGRMLLDVNFSVGTNQDMANVLTQNRVSSAQSRLPQEVVQQGITVKKQSPSILMIISL